MSLLPDAIYSKDDDPTAADAPVWIALDPCPNCGAKPHESPNGVNIVTGDPHWIYEHCWRCGYRPSVNTPSDDAQMRAQWEAFQAFQRQQQQSIANERGIAPVDDPSEVRRLQAELAAMKSGLSGRPIEDIPSSTIPSAAPSTGTVQGVAGNTPSARISGDLTDPNAAPSAVSTPDTGTGTDLITPEPGTARLGDGTPSQADSQGEGGNVTQAPHIDTTSTAPNAPDNSGDTPTVI